MGTSTNTRPSPGSKTSTADVETNGTAGWKRRSLHLITLPSGMQVTIRLPDVGMLIRRDLVPDRLRNVAMKVAIEGTASLSQLDPETGKPEGFQDEDLKLMFDLFDLLVIEMVVEPSLSLLDLDPESGIPREDYDMLVSLAQRERNTDAAGVTIGVEPLSRWERFRRHHECAPDCDACEAVRREFSTVHVGAV